MNLSPHHLHQKPSKREAKSTKEEKPQKISEERENQIKKEVEKRIAKEKETFSRQMALLEKEIQPDYLIECASYLQPSHYADVTIERAITSVCGYPLCDNPLAKEKIYSNKKYSISVSKQQIYDATELRNFCSENCLISSHFYMKQLDDQPVYLRTQPTQVILRGQLKKKREKSSKKSYQTEPSELKIFEKESKFFEPPSLESLQLNDQEERDTNIYQVQRELESIDIKQNEEEQTVDLNFKIPKSLKIELSSFGMIYTYLEEWYSPQTKEFLRGKSIIATKNDEFEGFKKQTLSFLISNQLPTVLSTLKFSSLQVEKEIDQLISTFSFRSPIPTFTKQQLNTLCLLFLFLISCLERNGKENISIPYDKFGIDPHEFQEFIEIFRKE